MTEQAAWLCETIRVEQFHAKLYKVCEAAQNSVKPRETAHNRRANCVKQFV